MDATPAVRPARRAGAAIVCAGLGVWLGAFVWLAQVVPPVIVTDDTIRDQLLARDCTELGECHLVGAPASIRTFYHGPAWVDLLIAVRALGGEAASARRAVLALLALAVATVFVVVWRWLRPLVALPAAVLLCLGLGLDVHPSQLVNTSAAVFPDALTAAAALCFALSGKRRYLLAAAFALAVAVSAHVASLTLVPSLLAVAALARPAWWRDVAVAAGVAASTYGLSASAALHANLVGLAEHGRLLPALVGVVAVVGIAGCCGPAFRRRSPAQRAWLVGAILIAPFGLAVLWLTLGAPQAIGLSYVHPVMTPLAVAGGALAALPFAAAARRHHALGWIPSAAALAVALVAAWRPVALATAPPPWTLAEARAIADAAVRRGWSYERLVFHTQSRGCRELLMAMGIAAPPPRADDPADHRQLQVVKLERAALPPLVPPADVVELAPGTVAVVRDLASWLDPAALTVCRTPLGGGAEQCADAASAATAAHVPPRFVFAARANPTIHSLDVPPPYAARYEIPLAPVAGQPRDVILADPAAADCGWRITRVDGVRVEGALPARRVRLHADGATAGRLVIEGRFDVGACGSDDTRYPPCLFESAPGDPLAAALEAR